MKLTPQKTVTSNKGSTVTCDRCNGNGQIRLRLGNPGQDPREIRYRDILWGPVTIVLCAVCNGTGNRRKKPTIKGRWLVTENGATPNRGPNPYRKETT
jgi:hypothetical protein